MFVSCASLWLKKLPPAACGCTQMPNLSFQFDDLLLLLFDCVEHGPDDRIVVKHQIAVSSRAHCLRDYFLHCLCAEADAFTCWRKAEGVVWFVFVAHWLQAHHGIET